MAKKDIAFLVDAPTKSLDVSARTASADGASVDLKNYHGCLIIVDVDAWTDGSHTFVVNESDDNSTFTAVDAADLSFVTAGAISSTGTIVVDGAADDDQAYKLGYVGNKRYIRVETTVTGTTTGAIYGALLVPSHKKAAGKLVS